MRRLVGLLFGFCVLHGMVLVAAIVYGRGTPLPEAVRALGFDRCGDVPCFMEILPGQTPWLDVQVTLARRPGSNVWDKRILVKSSVGSEAALYPSINGVTIGRIYITPSRDTPLPAGWIVERFGLPCGVSVYYETGIMTLRYPFLLANVRIADNYLHLYAPIMQLQLTNPSFISTTQPNQCVDNITGWKMENRTWQGFASIRHYLTR
jgi:hypothetical protein